MNNAPTTVIPSTPGQVLADLYGAVAATDVAAAAACLHPEVVLHVPGTHPRAGDHVGIEAVLTFVADSVSGGGPVEQIEVVDLLSGNDHAAALCEIDGLEDGVVTMHNRTVHLMRFEDGLIREVWFHNWDQGVVDAFWG